jgi:mRNA interferase YafQ
MRTLRSTSQFKKGFKRMSKRSMDMKKLHAVIEKLVKEEELDVRYQDHPLQGRYAEARDCHISPDWMQTNVIVGKELGLIRTGTHSNLFET